MPARCNVPEKLPRRPGSALLSPEHMLPCVQCFWVGESACMGNRRRRELLEGCKVKEDSIPTSPTGQVGKMRYNKPDFFVAKCDGNGPCECCTILWERMEGFCCFGLKLLRVNPRAMIEDGFWPKCKPPLSTPVCKYLLQFVSPQRSLN